MPRLFAAASILALSALLVQPALAEDAAAPAPAAEAQPTALPQASPDQTISQTPQPESMEELGEQIEAEDDPLIKDESVTAGGDRKAEVPTIAMYWAVMESEHDDLKALLRVYIGGVSDGFYAYERIRQQTSPNKHFCYGDPAKFEGGPSRDAAVRYFDEFTEKMAMGQDVNRVASYPIMTTFSIMYRYKFLCEDDKAPIQLDPITGLAKMRPLVQMKQGEVEADRSDQVPNLNMFWAAEDVEIKSEGEKTPEWRLIMAYIKGVSDGVFALDHARINRFGTKLEQRGICYELDKRHGLPPTRKEAAASLRRLMFKMFDTVGEEKARNLPIPLILPRALLLSYGCK